MSINEIKARGTTIGLLIGFAIMFGVFAIFIALKGNWLFICPALYSALYLLLAYLQYRVVKKGAY